MMAISPMKRPTRRSFLRSSLLIGSALTMAARPRAAWCQPVGANNDLRLAVIGTGQISSMHLGAIKDLRGARLVALCDVDPRNLAQKVERVGRWAKNLFTTTDARKILERSDVDAVIISTCDHWHALLAIWAMQAGKDVYVEKPLSQFVWEGRQVIDTVARSGRILQVGTQSRSGNALPELIAYLREGHIGRIRWIHALYNKLRENIGRKAPWTPDWLDYDLYCGPAPVVPLVRNQLHYDWHWFWNTGTGDATNIGVHVYDIARWISGHEGLPRRVMNVAGHFVVDDSAETPNTQLSFFDFGGIPIVQEIRGLPRSPGDDAMDAVRGLRSGVIVQCEGGYFSGYDGGFVYDNEGRKIKGFQGKGTRGHIANFLEAVRRRDSSLLTAPAATGHASSAACNFATISHRIGRQASLADIRSALPSFDAAQDIFSSVEKHVRAHGVDPDRQRFTLGPWLELDGATDTVRASAGLSKEALATAQLLTRGRRRAGFTLPGE